MLIQLRQPEIEEAIKMYVTTQGINLNGKKVDMNFTSGRGNNGLTVDLNIVDAKLSDLTIGTAQTHTQAPVADLTSGETKGPVAEVFEEAAGKQEDPVNLEEEEEEPAPTNTSTRLFG